MFLKDRQYYHDTQIDKVYHIDLCVSDDDDKITKCVKEFVKNFKGDEILYIFIYLNKEYNKYTKYVNSLTEHIKNHICLWSWNSSLETAIKMVDEINTTRYKTSPWLIQSGLKVREKDEQVVFNITKKYLRQKKLNKILDETKEINIK